jgi:glycosyltransferase involved in cell wall biosynthesis
MNKKNPLVSVGIPAYNRPKGLSRLIKQIQNQSYKNIEIIISDNCSENEEVEKVALSLAESDNRIKYIRQTSNIGMFENFRYVLRETKGEFFMWASDDDEFYPDFIKKCLNVLIKDKGIVLCSPICKVFHNESEVIKYKPDYHTVGLNKMQRMKKIAFYIKKGHGALFGLYRREAIIKFSTVTYLDADGIFLLQLSQYGSFYQLNEVLMHGYIDYVENNIQTSTTFQKEKMIDMYKMKPKFFLMHYEKFTMFLYVLLKSLRWKELSFFQHFNILGIIYRSFWGYNTFKPFSLIRSLVFYFKNRKVIVLINVQPSNNEIKEKLENIVTEVDQILISVSSSDWGEEGMNQIIAFDNLKDLIANYPNKITFYKGAWQTEYAQLQYSLDFIKNNFIDVTHCILIDHDSLPAPHIIKKAINYIQKFKYYNRRIDFSFQNIEKFKNKESITLFPIRKHVVFKSESEMSAGKLKVNFNA